MQIVLGADKRNPSQLANLYGRAVKEAEELLVATAFLTSWDLAEKPGPHCKRILFIVGTDFGRTRKSACRNVLKWLPKDCLADFLAVTNLPEGTFHPKLIAWKAGGQQFMILGSSNLSRAAFETNVEANLYTPLTQTEYRSLRKWLLDVSEATQPVTSDWLDYHYREAPERKGQNRTKPKNRGLTIRLPAGASYAQGIAERRRQQAAFAQIKGQVVKLVNGCAIGKLTNTDFWQQFWHLWSKHPSRFQGSGLQFTAKSANWREACASLREILTAAQIAPQTLDQVVATEINRLAGSGNPVRGAWLTEILCHLYPRMFPLVNAPVSAWLSEIKWRARRGTSEGQRYIDLARQLREVVRQNPRGAAQPRGA